MEKCFGVVQMLSLLFFIRHMTSWELTSEGLVILCVEVTHSKSVSHNRAIFCGGWSSAIGDIKYLICHVISQNFVIEGSCVFMDGSSSREGNQDFKENMFVEGNFSSNFSGGTKGWGDSMVYGSSVGGTCRGWSIFS